MAQFSIFERVPAWNYYRKTIEAESVEAALEIAKKWAEFDGDKEDLLFGDAIEGIPVTYEAEPALPVGVWRQRRSTDAKTDARYRKRGERHELIAELQELDASGDNGPADVFADRRRQIADRLAELRGGPEDQLASAGQLHHEADARAGERCFAKYLDCAMAHLPLDFQKALWEGIGPFTEIGQDDYHRWVYVDEETLSAERLEDHPMPQAVQKIVRFALDRGCNVILFDPDGCDLPTEFEIFEDEEE